MEVEYRGLTDEQLVELAKENDQVALEYIFSHYKRTVREKAGAYFLMGGDMDDLIQEGMIGLFSAVVSFNPDKRVKFNTFAQVCIERQILTAIKKDSSKKNSPLNSSVSIPEGDEHEALILSMGPEDIIIDQENVRSIEAELCSRLSKFERTVFNELIQGKNYTQIAEQVNASKKSVDNAIQRIKRKMKKSIK